MRKTGQPGGLWTSIFQPYHRFGSLGSRGGSWGFLEPPGVPDASRGFLELPEASWSPLGFPGPPGASWGLLVPPAACWSLLMHPGVTCAPWGSLEPRLRRVVPSSASRARFDNRGVTQACHCSAVHVRHRRCTFDTLGTAHNAASAHIECSECSQCQHRLSESKSYCRHRKSQT